MELEELFDKLAADFNRKQLDRAVKNMVIVDPDEAKQALTEWRDSSQLVLIPVGPHGVFTIVDKEFEHLKEKKWSLSAKGYAYRETYVPTRKKIYLSREVVGIGEWSEDKTIVVDHINGLKLDNRKANLRVCKQSENAANTGKSKNNTSGYKGVQFSPGNTPNPWRAVIMKDGKNINVGRYGTREEAALAYNKKALELFGEFAYQNELKPSNHKPGGTWAPNPSKEK